MVDGVNGWRPPTGGLVERARAIAEGLLPLVETRDAATTVLLRDSAVGTGVEACLLHRAETMAFAAGVYVFPGGTVDPDDTRSAVAWAVPEPARTARVLTADVPLARALVCAAVRETFETDRTAWLRPGEALVRHASGRLSMLPPTAFTLAQLAEYPDVASVLAAAATTRDAEPVLPGVVVSGDEARLLLPHEERYGE